MSPFVGASDQFMVCSPWLWGQKFLSEEGDLFRGGFTCVWQHCLLWYCFYRLLMLQRLLECCCVLKEILSKYYFINFPISLTLCKNYFTCSEALIKGVQRIFWACDNFTIIRWFLNIQKSHQKKRKKSTQYLYQCIHSDLLGLKVQVNRYTSPNGNMQRCVVIG